MMSRGDKLGINELAGFIARQNLFSGDDEFQDRIERLIDRGVYIRAAGRTYKAIRAAARTALFIRVPGRIRRRTAEGPVIYPEAKKLFAIAQLQWDHLSGTGDPENVRLRHKGRHLLGCKALRVDGSIIRALGRAFRSCHAFPLGVLGCKKLINGKMARIVCFVPRGGRWLFMTIAMPAA
jgi:hypothetical protein